MAFFDMPEAAGCYQRYLDYYCNGREAEAQLTLTQFMQSSDPIENTARYGARFTDSAFARETLSPLGLNGYIRVPVRNPRGGGMLAVMRGPRDRAFSRQEEQALIGIASYLRHAFEAPAAPVDTFLRDGEDGLLILDPQGRVRHRTARAAFLLYCLIDSAGGSPASPFDNSDLKTLLVRLVRELERPHAGPPAVTIVNAWGAFHIEHALAGIGSRE